MHERKERCARALFTRDTEAIPEIPETRLRFVKLFLGGRWRCSCATPLRITAGVVLRWNKVRELGRAGIKFSSRTTIVIRLFLAPVQW
jgi:hypothetical protein